MLSTLGLLHYGQVPISVESSVESTAYLPCLSLSASTTVHYNSTSIVSIHSSQGYKVVQDYRRTRKLSTERILGVMAQYRYEQITAGPVSCTYLRMYQGEGITPYQTKPQHQNSELEVFISHRTLNE